jgi:tRNA (guanine37-N1)-methyltransferase
MKFYILTIFPEYFSSPLKVGLLGKAIERGLIEVEVLNLRDFAQDKHRTVDDEPFGGGEGMVFKPEPLYQAIQKVKEKDPDTHVIYLSPQGKLFNQKVAESLAKHKSILFICGRYEGIDERIRAHFVDEEVSIGDYVVFGGEVASLVVIEAISRLIPGVVGRKDSVDKESFTSGLLKYPCYTRPREFLGYKVPEVLVSGDHAEIERFRRQSSLKITLERRPELLHSANLSQEDYAFLKSLLEKQRVYLFLLHYPVKNKEGETIASAITSLDLHDLSRLGRTYGLKGVFVIQPLSDQREIAERICRHWTEGFGAKYNPTRKEAIKLVKLFETLDSAIAEVERECGEKPLLIATDASPKRSYITVEKLRELLWEKPIALILGTAWGLCDEVFDQCDYFLEPIWGRLDAYNHLSVRSAGSILIDRILGIYSFWKK